MMDASPKIVTACVILIGDEILSGRTQDKNLHVIASRLGEVGIRVHHGEVIPDDEAIIIKTVNACRDAYDYVFTTGGIGPTHDDMTAAAIARAFGVPLECHPEAEARLRAHYRAEDLNEARLKMAQVPRGATLIDNPVSAAPGFAMENVFVLAGVPAIMAAMLETLLPHLSGGVQLFSRTVRAFLAEGEIAAALGDIQAAFSDLRIGSYPFFRDRRFGVSLVLRGEDMARLMAAEAALCQMIEALGASPVKETGPGHEREPKEG